MQTSHEKRIITSGKYVNLATRRDWEFVERKNISGIVAIVAVTDSGKLLLIEQYRPPVDKNVIELPAGLAGDSRENAGEALENAARRELLEETGYAAREMEQLVAGASSAGITDEFVTLFRARGLTKIGTGEGDGSEQLIHHEIPLGQVVDWLRERSAQGAAVDMKVYAGLLFAD